MMALLEDPYILVRGRAGPIVMGRISPKNEPTDSMESVATDSIEQSYIIINWLNSSNYISLPNPRVGLLQGEAEGRELDGEAMV